MRWKPKRERHKSKELKRVSKFLWWPMRIRGEWRWLEKVVLRYRWQVSAPWSVPAGIEGEGEWRFVGTQDQRDELHASLYGGKEE